MQHKCKKHGDETLPYSCLTYDNVLRANVLPQLTHHLSARTLAPFKPLALEILTPVAKIPLRSLRCPCLTAEPYVHTHHRQPPVLRYDTIPGSPCRLALSTRVGLPETGEPGTTTAMWNRRQGTDDARLSRMPMLSLKIPRMVMSQRRHHLVGPVFGNSRVNTVVENHKSLTYECR